MPDRPVDPALVALLQPTARLAWVYAPRAARHPTLALLALDARLGAIVRATHEPLLGQMRLAWWRDRLREDPASWPAGEPILAALAGWGEAARGLARLVDGWEELLGDPPLPDAAFARFAAGRAAGWSVLARRFGCDAALPSVSLAAEGWALADLAAHLSAPSERGAIAAMLHTREWPPLRLPRTLRPLAVLYALARRARHDGALLGGPGSLLTALRVGIAGR